MTYCYWKRHAGHLIAYFPGCLLKNKSVFFNNQTIKQIDYKYCPYCGKQIKEEEL